MTKCVLYNKKKLIECFIQKEIIEELYQEYGMNRIEPWAILCREANYPESFEIWTWKGMRQMDKK